MQATAFIIGADGQCNQGLLDLSLDIGFSRVLDFTNIAAAEQQVLRAPIAFFLFSLDHNDLLTSRIAREIRRSRNRQIMYAPMIGLTEQPEPDLIETALQLGFDDILIPPFSAKTVAPRLKFHLNRRITFFETTQNFSPDRRAADSHNKKSGNPLGLNRDGDHRKILINRSLDTGISILKDQFHRQQRPKDPGESISIAV